jgi:hypothetical protein
MHRKESAVLVNRSMITQIESCLREVLGKPTIKSILISSHFEEGIGRGWRIPAVFRWLALTLWQISHSKTYLAISRLIRVHQKFCFKSWYIFVLPGCIENLDRWASSNIYLQSLWSLGTTIHSLNHKTPSGSTRKHLYFLSPCDIFCLMILTPLLRCWARTILSLSVAWTERWFKSPWGTISRLSFLISQQRVSLKASTDKQEQCALRLSASAMTLALPGW